MGVFLDFDLKEINNSSYNYDNNIYCRKYNAGSSRKILNNSSFIK